jgi:hypothetical protein
MIVLYCASRRRPPSLRARTTARMQFSFQFNSRCNSINGIQRRTKDEKCLEIGLQQHMVTPELRGDTCGRRNVTQSSNDTYVPQECNTQHSSLELKTTKNNFIQEATTKLDITR